MIIKGVSLTNFRNFKRKRLKFSPELTIIIGPNASGKTNILESLYLLSTGKSFRARVEEEIIRYGEEIARVAGSVVDDGQKLGLEIVLTRGEITVGEEPDEKKQRAPRKKLLVNGVSRRLFNFAANFRVVLFGPWDLDLVTESPSTRRKFLDFVLSQVDREYWRASLSYEKGLRQRNKLLFRIREEGLPRSQLVFWNRLLIKNGANIDVSDNQGRTALKIAAKLGNNNVIKALLEGGAKINAMRNFSSTALIEAVSGQQLETVKLLIQSGADVNATDEKGNTPR